MKKLFATVFLLLCLIPSISKSAGVTQIVGINVDCGTTACGLKLPFFEILCSGINCPFRINSSADGTKLVGDRGGVYVYSTNGSTWIQFPTLPSRSIDSGVELAVAGDGQIIMSYLSISPSIGCSFNKTSNNGTTWTEVEFKAGVDCSGNTSPYVMLMKCVGSTCVLPVRETGTGFFQIYQSVNNGVNWNSATGFSVAPITNVADFTFFNGIQGVILQENFAARTFSTTTGSGGWIGSAWPIPGTPSSCSVGGSSPIRTVFTICNAPSFAIVNPQLNLDTVALTATAHTTLAGTFTYGGVTYVSGPVTSGSCHFSRNTGGVTTVFTQVPLSLGCNSAGILGNSMGGTDPIQVGNQFYGASVFGATNVVYRLNP